MPAPCKVCTHPDREAIDSALVSGEPNRRVAKAYGLTEASVRRHKLSHIPKFLLKAHEAKEIVRADDLLEQLECTRARTLSILERAEEAEERAEEALRTASTTSERMREARLADEARRTAISALREARNNLELLARLMGELRDGNTVNILVMPEWIDLRTQILSAVDPYPEAKRAIAEVVSHVDG